MSTKQDGDGNFEEGNLSKKSDKTTVLDHFGRNLVELAKKGKLDPIVGRDREIDKVVQILNKRKKNNPIIVGEPGVGKTAIIEGLAIRIAEKNIDSSLWNKKIYELNMSSIVAGTKFRGQFEERMEAIIKEVIENQDLILFIDEVHNIIGAGNSSGSLDASNIIKPQLARGVLKIIGATTLDEYKKTIENDGALERRFQKVILNTPSNEETIQILKNIKGHYEKHHGVSYSDEIIEKIVQLSDRYINNRNFPDKAIDLMDESGAYAKLKNNFLSDEIHKINNELSEVIILKKEVVAKQDYKLAAVYRDKEKSLKAKIELELLKIDELKKSQMISITDLDVSQIIANNTGIPVEKISQSELESLGQMFDYINSSVIGQEDAVKSVVKAIQRSKVGVNDPNKPIASFIFLGQTGIGKTHLAKKLASFLFKNDSNFIRFDMSEYMDSFNVTKLIGAPNGYVGYEEKGQLTEAVKNYPYSVVLFDEVEKAHPDIFNILLQVLDEGQLTDSKGTVVNFKNTVIIMTSNIGTSKISQNSMGFFEGNKSKGNITNMYLEELKKHFNRPELINRIDQKIVFFPLDKTSIRKIVDLELKSTLKRIEGKNYFITITDELKNFLGEKGYSETYGARELKRTLVTYIEDVFTENVINGVIKEGNKYILDVNSTGEVFASLDKTKAKKK